MRSVLIHYILGIQEELGGLERMLALISRRCHEQQSCSTRTLREKSVEQVDAAHIYFQGYNGFTPIVRAVGAVAYRRVHCTRVQPSIVTRRCPQPRISAASNHQTRHISLGSRAHHESKNSFSFVRNPKITRQEGRRIGDTASSQGWRESYYLGAEH